MKTLPCYSHVRPILLSLGILSLLAGCSDDETLSADKGRSPTVVVPYAVGGSTRAQNETFESFSLFSTLYLDVDGDRYDLGVNADDIRFTKSGGDWSSVPYYYRSDMANENAYGVSPNIDAVQNPVFTLDEQSFEYKNPAEESDQMLIWIGSELDMTPETANDNLRMGFKMSLFSWDLQALNMHDEYETIIVGGITLHNLPNRGKFTFSTTQKVEGSWVQLGTADADYSNYSQTLTTPKTLSQIDLVDVVNEPVILMPFGQPTALWDPVVDGAPSNADADHKFYIELKCQITKEVDGHTVYLWGSEDGTGKYPKYESVYFPYDPGFDLDDWQMAVNGTYYLLFSEGYDSAGNVLKPHEESGVAAFNVLQSVDFQIPDGNVDEWGTDAFDAIEIPL